MFDNPTSAYENGDEIGISIDMSGKLSDISTVPCRLTSLAHEKAMTERNSVMAGNEKVLRFLSLLPEGDNTGGSERSEREKRGGVSGLSGGVRLVGLCVSLDEIAEGYVAVLSGVPAVLYEEA